MPTSPWGVDQTSVAGLFFKPDGLGPFPAIVLLHTDSGMIPHVTQDWPQVLTANGYAVLTADSYGPRGLGTGSDYSQKLVAQTRDAYGALDYLASRPDIDERRIGVMGFSNGAIAIAEYLIPTKPRSAGERNFKAAAALYGRCNRMSSADLDYIPLLIIAAEHDVRLNTTCIWAIDGLGFAGAVLKGAYHAFDVNSSVRVDPFGNRMFYSATATSEARKRVLAFFAKHLAAKGT